MDFTRLVGNFLIVLVSCTSIYCDHEPSVYFGLMVSSAPTLNTSGVVSAVDRALEIVNSDSTILPGVRLQYTRVLDTQCNRTRALELFNEEVISANKTLVAVVGCGCSSSTEAVAKASNGSIPLISYASTSVTLSDKPNFLRTVPSDESLPPALATVMQYYGWRQVAIVTERESQFLQLLPLLNGSLSQAGISVVNRFISGDSLSKTIKSETIFEGDSRIFFLSMNPRPAISILCKAIQEGREYPEYIWLTPGWYQEGWWRDDEDYLLTLNCSSTSLQQQLERSLTLLAHPNTEIFNITETFNSNAYAMDAVMTLALALNETLMGTQLTNLSLSDTIQATMFTGISGSVKFNSQGNREDVIVLLQQFRVDLNDSLTLQNVAKIEGENFTYINGETNTTVWPGSEVTGIPPLINVLNALKIPVYAYVLSLVTIGVILSAVCFIFNIVFRNRKVVKLTSPNLNYVIILGAVLLMVGNVFVPSPSTDLPLLAIFCPISRIFLSVGYDICFVVALVKTIRVAYIFWNNSPSKKIVKDWQLLLLATGIIMIEVIFTIPVLALIYVNGDTQIVIDEARPPFVNDQGYTVVNRMIVCGNSSILYFIYIALTISFKLIIHIIGLILAFLTRKVNIDPLNDSRYSAILIYISFALLAGALIIIFFVEENNTYAGVWTTFVLVEVCVFLGLNFIPKMVSLYRDPKGENIFGETTTLNRSQLAASMTIRSNSISEKTKFTAIAAESKLQ